MSRTSRKRRTVLVIEDYLDSREMLRLLLENLEYSVLTAEDGPKALEIVRSNHVDLILTDFGLPEMDGLQLVRRIRALNDHCRRVPIIMLTAFDRDDHEAAALQAGCTDFLTKPPSYDALQQLMERLLLDAECGEETAFYEVHIIGPK